MKKKQMGTPIHEIAAKVLTTCDNMELGPGGRALFTFPSRGGRDLAIGRYDDLETCIAEVGKLVPADELLTIHSSDRPIPKRFAEPHPFRKKVVVSRVPAEMVAECRSPENWSTV